MNVQFVKMHGSSNDFIIVDEWDGEVVATAKKADFSMRISHRHSGVGSDGVVFVLRSGRADASLVFYNPDGSSAEMSGNGMMCFAKYVHDSGHVEKTTVTIETPAGVKTVGLTMFNDLVERVRIDMGSPQLTRGEIGVSGDPKARFVDEEVSAGGERHKVTAVGIGNPHAVVFVSDVDADGIRSLGEGIRRMRELFTRGVNVHLVQDAGGNRFKIRSFERGVEEETLACGTGVCASAVAAVLTGRADPTKAFRFMTRGGELNVELKMRGDEFSVVFLIGPAVEVFRGSFEYNPSEAFEKAAYNFIGGAARR
jgi:diaminopimelate epimerase